MRLLLLSLIPFGALMAQESVPVDHEAKHHLVFENAHTRVFDVVVPAGDSTLYHVHAHDYVYVTFGKSKLDTQPLGGAISALPLADGEVRYTKGPITHRVINRARTPFHNLTIEVLDPVGAPLTPRTAGDSVLENDRVRITRFLVDTGATLFRGPRRGPTLVVAVDAGRLEVRSGDVVAAVAVKPGWFRWMDPGQGDAIANSGRTKVELVGIEWK